jgi:hypothetical protein
MLDDVISKQTQSKILFYYFHVVNLQHENIFHFRFGCFDVLQCSNALTSPKIQTINIYLSDWVLGTIQDTRDQTIQVL